MTVSFGPTSMFDTGLPSSQVALGSPQPDGTVCGDRVAGRAATLLNVIVFGRVGLEWSSSWKLVGDSPPPAV